MDMEYEFDFYDDRQALAFLAELRAALGNPVMSWRWASNRVDLDITLSDKAKAVADDLYSRTV